MGEHSIPYGAVSAKSAGGQHVIFALVSEPFDELHSCTSLSVVDKDLQESQCLFRQQLAS